MYCRTKGEGRHYNLIHNHNHNHTIIIITNCRLHITRYRNVAILCLIPHLLPPPLPPPFSPEPRSWTERTDALADEADYNQTDQGSEAQVGRLDHEDGAIRFVRCRRRRRARSRIRSAGAGAGAGVGARAGAGRVLRRIRRVGRFDLEYLGRRVDIYIWMGIESALEWLEGGEEEGTGTDQLN